MSLIERVLNSTRRQHTPSYLAARFAAESVIGDDDSTFSTRCIRRKYLETPELASYAYPRFKSQSADGEFSYRDMSSLGPFDAMAESLVLAILAGSLARPKTAPVYSYWVTTSQDSPTNFVHFLEGYELRNSRVHAHFVRNPDHVAVVMDIKSFYPSVDRDFVRKAVSKLLSRADITASDRDLCSAAVEKTLRLCPTGLPIGPDLSHVLADLAMGEIDTKLSGIFGDQYLRYVDDIIVLCPAERVQSTLKTLRAVVESRFELNEDKADEVPATRWLRFAPKVTSGVQEGSFEAYKFWIKSHLVNSPQNLSNLQSALADASIYLPLDRLVDAASSSVFLALYRALLSFQWPVVVGARKSKVAEIVDQGKALRSNLHRELLTELDTPYNTTPQESKWRSQRLRRLVGSLMYFTDMDNHTEIYQIARNEPDLAQFSAVIGAAKSGQANELLQMPGPAAAALGSFASLRQMHFELPVQLSEIESESASTLLAYGCVSNSADLFLVEDESRRAYFQFAGGKKAPEREFSDFSYLDEVRCLQGCSPDKPPLQYLNTRFSERETPTFEFLNLADPRS